MRIYSCCSRPVSEDEGCIRSPHVFYESKPEDLHSRHPFSHSRKVSSPESSEKDDGLTPSDTALEVASLDCEMVYTTGGMRVARVSVVDGSGAEVFDELVRMDEGVEVTLVPP
jgi:RNA exonuclease 1